MFGSAQNTICRMEAIAESSKGVATRTAKLSLIDSDTPLCQIKGDPMDSVLGKMVPGILLDVRSPNRPTAAVVVNPGGGAAAVPINSEC